MATQEIIVYRNPAEKAAWDAIQALELGPWLFILVVAGVVTLAAAAGTIWFTSSWKNRIHQRRAVTIVSWTVFVVTGALMAWKII